MSSIKASVGALLLWTVIYAVPSLAQADAEQPSPAAATTARPDLPPATKLEGFDPAAGSLVTVGYDDLGSAKGVSVDVREVRDSRGETARGLVVEVHESQYRRERSLVDADEVPELIRGIDALLQVTANPTQFKNFEVRYTTRGELRLTAFNSTIDRGIRYAVQAGRGLKAQRFLGDDDMRKLRAMFEAATQKLSATRSPS